MSLIFDRECDEDTVMDFVTGSDKIDVSAFDFASAAAALTHVQILSADTAMIELGADRYVILNYVNTSGVFISAADFVI